MGLDLVELTMEVEGAFGISIPDEEASKLETVGSLHDYVCRRVGARADGACVTANAFYRFRRAAIEILGIPRESVRPAAFLADVSPAAVWHSRWEHVGRLAGLQLPPLQSRVRVHRTSATVLTFIVATAVVLLA